MSKYVIPLKSDKQVKIPQSLLISLTRIFVFNDDDPEIWNSCKQMIEDKLDRMENHDLYSKSKDKSLSKVDRDKNRIKYLDKVGIDNSFRYENYSPDTFSYGRICYNSATKRYHFCKHDLFEKEFHCGDSLEIKINQEWIKTRIEMKNNKFYLVGFEDDFNFEYCEIRIQK